MGTASLVIGLALIILGFSLITSYLFRTYPSDTDLIESIIGILILVIPMIAVGALLLRKFDKDRKKEKNS